MPKSQIVSIIVTETTKEMRVPNIPSSFRDVHALFLALFVLLSFANFAAVVLTIYFSRKFNHVRAKAPVNILMIFLSGLIHSWFHYLYNEPIYEPGDGSGACLVIGYVFQHLFGSTMWFYFIWFRLIKFGSVFQFLNVDDTDSRFRVVSGELKVTNRCFFIKSFMKRYILICSFAFLFAVLPVLIFILNSSANPNSLTVDEATSLCATPVEWKEVFVSLNIFYFVCLLISLCLIPRLIHNKYFNEATSLRNIVLFAGCVFLLETWLSFRFSGVDFVWVGVSDLLIFIMHTYTIYNLVWKRLFEAIRGNKHYERLFNEELESSPMTIEMRTKILTDPEVRHDFLEFCLKKHRDVMVKVHSNNIDGKVYNISTNNISLFTLTGYEILDQFEDPSTRDDSLINLSKLITKYLIPDVSGVNRIGLDGSRVDVLTKDSYGKIEPKFLSPILSIYVEILYNRFHLQYQNEPSALAWFEAELGRRKELERLNKLGLTNDDKSAKYLPGPKLPAIVTNGKTGDQVIDIPDDDSIFDMNTYALDDFEASVLRKMQKNEESDIGEDL